jgi:hypothetical protein
MYYMIDKIVTQRTKLFGTQTATVSPERTNGAIRV